MKLPEFTGKTYRSHSGKNWEDMTITELWDEIVVLLVRMDKLTEKNRARKRALKDINRSVLIKNAALEETLRLNQVQNKLVRDFKARAETAEEIMRRTNKDLEHVTQLAVGYEAQVETLKRRHGYETERDDHKLVATKPESIFFRFTRRLRGVSGA